MSVNKEGSTALHLASSAGSLSCIKVGLLHVDCDTLCFALILLYPTSSASCHVFRSCWKQRRAEKRC